MPAPVKREREAIDAPRLRALSTYYARWMVDLALPLWIEHGVDRQYGGFFDRLDPATCKNCAEYKRVRVTARQICVFTQASLLGFTQGAPVVEHGLDHLLGPCARSLGGYHSKLDHSGNAIEQPVDLYDNAFALFALSQAYKLNQDRAIFDAACDLCRFLNENMAHVAGGWMESVPPALPRRQNPHMHLLEAALGWIDAVGPVEPFTKMADDIITLAEKYFLSPDGTYLLEYFGEEWSIREPLAEPGHHFEWIWLVSEYRRLMGAGFAVDGLYRTAWTCGYDPKAGLLVGELHMNGSIAKREVRIWPHTEWLRAELISGRHHLVEASAALRQFLDHPMPGLWYEQYSPEAGFVSQDVPASSLYHIMGAVQALCTAVEPELT